MGKGSQNQPSFYKNITNFKQHPLQTASMKDSSHPRTPRLGNPLAEFWRKQSCSSGRSFPCSPRAWGQLCSWKRGLVSFPSRECLSPDFSHFPGAGDGLEKPPWISSALPGTRHCFPCPPPASPVLHWGLLGVPGPWSAQAPGAGLTHRPVLGPPQ